MDNYDSSLSDFIWRLQNPIIMEYYSFLCASQIHGHYYYSYVAKSRIQLTLASLTCIFIFQNKIGKQSHFQTPLAMLTKKNKYIQDNVICTATVKLQAFSGLIGIN